MSEKNNKNTLKYPRQRGLFNTFVILVSIFIPAIAFLFLSIPTSKNGLISKLAKGNLTNGVIFQFLFYLLVGYAILFALIAFLQKITENKDTKQMVLVDKNYYKFVNGLYGFVLAVFLFVYNSVSDAQADSILFFKFMVLSFTASNFFFTFCELNLKQYNSEKLNTKSKN